MIDIANDRVGPMLNPPHLSELIRESMDEVGWIVTETAEWLGCERRTLSRLPNGKAGVSANMAPAAHFSALLSCKPGGPAILASEGDDAVCDDPPGTDRAALHERIVARIAAFLGL